MKKKKKSDVDLQPVKDKIKEKVSDGQLSNEDIAEILHSTKNLYKEAPLSELDILRIYNTMIDKLRLGIDKNYKVPILLRIIGVITCLAWLTLLPNIIGDVSLCVDLIKGNQQVLTSTTLITVILHVVFLLSSISFTIFAGIFMFLNKRILSVRLLYVAIGSLCGLLFTIVSLDGVGAFFVYALIYSLILIGISVYLHPQLYQERRFYRLIKQLDDEVRYKEGRLGLSVDQSKGYIELDFFNLFWIFIIGCVVGLLAEYVFHILFVWGFDSSNWYDRAGLLFGPFSPIYGFGGVFMTLFLNRFRNLNPILLFCLTTLIGGAFEYCVSWFLEIAFGIEAWNYSGMFLSIGGRTCLLFAAMFGVMGFVWIKWALPACMKLINMIPWKLRYPITFVAAVFMIVNCIMTLQSIDCWSQRQAGVEPVAPIEQFYAQNYDDEFMQKRFASMSFQDNKSARSGITQ